MQIYRIKKLREEILRNALEREGQATGAYAPLLEGFEGNASEYYRMLEDTDLTDYLQEAPEDFQFDKEQAIADYRTRNQGALDEMIKRSIGDIEGEGAASGSLFSGATGKSIARSTADITANALKEGEDYALREEQNQYQKYMDKFNQATQLANQRMSAIQGNLANRGTLFGTQSNIFGNMRGEVTGIQTASDEARFGTMADEGAARAAKAGTTRGRESFFQGFGAGLGG